MVNAIIGVGITYGVCYAIVAIVFAIIGMFACGYESNKMSGVFKVMTGLGLVGIGIISIIVSILATVCFGINFIHIIFVILFGGIGQIGQHFIQETIIAFGIDIVAITTIIITIKMFFHLTMTKEERKSFYKDIKEQIWG